MCQSFWLPNRHSRGQRRSNGVRNSGTRHEVVLRLKKQTRAASPRVALDGAARGLTLNRADWPFCFIFCFFSSLFYSDPTSPQPLLLLISCDPELRLTIRLRQRVIQVSIFPSLPFFLVLNGWNVLHLLLSLYVFCFFLVHFCF